MGTCGGGGFAISYIYFYMQALNPKRGNPKEQSLTKAILTVRDNLQWLQLSNDRILRKIGFFLFLKPNPRNFLSFLRRHTRTGRYTENRTFPRGVKKKNDSQSEHSIPIQYQNKPRPPIHENERD
jgi:hypothetical protein